MRRSGRPEFAPSSMQRRIVEQLVAVGQSHESVARAIGVAPKTLRAHFSDELANGCAHRKAEVIDILFKCARKNNVSAAKHLETLIRDAEMLEPPKPKDLPLGKKEISNREAASAHCGTSWQDLIDPPKQH